VFTTTPGSDGSVLSLHDALPIACGDRRRAPLAQTDLGRARRTPALAVPDRPEHGDGGGHLRHTVSDLHERGPPHAPAPGVLGAGDRRSTRLHSSHVSSAYAVSCL